MEDKVSYLTSRIVYWDIAKGIAIILMVLGHTDLPAVFRGIIFSFHMPFFVIANGYFVKEYDIKTIFFKSVKTLIYPYIMICMLSAMIYSIIYGNNELPLTLFLYKMKAMVGGMSKVSTRFYSFDSVWVVWFICALFISRNLYVMIMSVFGENKMITTCLICGLACIGYLLGKYYAFMPWSFDVALVCLVFVGIGDWLRITDFLNKKYSYTLILPFLIWTCIICSTRSYIELATRDYPAGILSFLEAIAGSIVLISVSKILAKNLFFSTCIAWFGKNSMIILGIHCIEMMYFNWNDCLFAYLPFRMTWINVFLIKIIVITIMTKVIEEQVDIWKKKIG